MPLKVHSLPPAQFIREREKGLQRGGKRVRKKHGRKVVEWEKGYYWEKVCDEETRRWRSQGDEGNEGEWRHPAKYRNETNSKKQRRRQILNESCIKWIRRLKAGQMFGGN